jgi:aminoglycoside phosphotransferase (APT) family kinase protein
MRHGYTNRTTRAGDVVRKSYEGPEARSRCAAELRALTRLRQLVPVPEVVSSGPAELTTAYVDGEHGQDLIEAGRAVEVLAACGVLLRRLHDLDPAILEPGVDGVIRHGDFGPNNVVFEPESATVTALLDWEFSGIGPAVDDVAWCEWIVRMHHPDAVGALPAFFDAYGPTPSWDERQRAMIDRCHYLEEFCRRWNPHGAAVTQWQERAAATARWRP